MSEMFLFSVLFAVFAVSVLSSPVPEEYELRMVTVLHKHGDRSPMMTYPNDPHGDESNWNNGFGQVTNAGKKQMHALGKWLRDRYGSLIPVTYSDKDVYARSTETTRDMMSAYLLLSGLYEPVGNDVWDPDIKWQPIPVRATPLGEEHTLMSVEPCPKLDVMEKELMESEYVKKHFDEFSSKTSHISEKAGFEGNKIVESIWLYDVFYSQDTHGFRIPDWSREYYPQPLGDMLAFLFRLHAYDKPLQRLTCGPLLKEVLHSIEDRISGNSTQKFREYSGHDAMIVDFLRCLNVDDDVTLPSYAGAVLLELYNGGDKYFVAVKYKVEDELRDLIIPGCGEFCDLEKFRELVAPVVPEDWHRECRV